MRLHFILGVFVLAMVSSSPPFFHASAEDDQCVGFLENCEKNCGEGKLNENKSLCKTWQGGVYKSCVCDGAGFDFESSEEMVRVVFSLFSSGILVRDVPDILADPASPHVFCFFSLRWGSSIKRWPKGKSSCLRIESKCTDFYSPFLFHSPITGSRRSDDARTMMASSSYAEEGSTEEAKGEGKEGEGEPRMIACEGPAGNGMTTSE